ncbi:protein GOLM2 isoform X5 [Gadus macrocephalus]|uniref:protein GOLM2 isoform X5 n=1 Tax=Gadus macrocephalus TaxID=80720 RepID=UPI0028CB488A|nr:protein GOLM2 isoform X5 [Gadus macrocephalus]
MIGFGANRRGGRLPSLFLIALMVIIAILSFNYWTVTSKHVRLLDEVAEVQAQVKRTDAARIRLEKRNTELMAQVDTHKKQIDQKEGDNNVLGSKIQARETLIKKCTDDKMKLHQDFTSQITEITRLKEQLKEINQEFMQQEEQMREVRKNRTTLERRLEYESLQCGRQIKQLTEEFEESRKTLALEVAKLRRSGLDSNKLGVQAQPQAGAEVEAERHTVADLVQGNVILKGVKKAQIAPKQKEAPKEVPAAVAAVPAKGFREQALDQPLLQQDRVGLGGGAGGGGEEEEEEEEEEVQVQQQQQQQAAVAAVVVPPGHIKQPVPQAVVDKPVLFDEDNKAAMRADEFGEQNRQLQAPVNVKAESVQMKALPVPPNPAQVPKPLEPHRVKDQVPVQLPPHHQNDEDRDMQGGRAGEYGKRRQAADIL